MVYLQSWEDFMNAVKQLYSEQPTKTRYVIKYRHKEGLVVLKVTDDDKCIKFKSDQASSIKKVEKLSLFFLNAMAGVV